MSRPLPFPMALRVPRCRRGRAAFVRMLPGCGQRARGDRVPATRVLEVRGAYAYLRPDARNGLAGPCP